MRYDTFKGCIPKTDPGQLPQGYAAWAENTDLQSGVLRAIKEPSKILLLNAGTKTVYRHEEWWRQFADDVDIARALTNSTGSRIYVTGAGRRPMQTDISLLHGGQYRRLGLSRPGAPLTIQFVGNPQPGAEIKHSVSYTYTRINRFGEESAPAPETVVVDIVEGQGVSLTGFATSQDADEDIVAYRIYRAGNAGFFWIHYPNTPQGATWIEGDFPVGMGAFADWDASAGDIRGESMSSLITGGLGLGRDWMPPPEDMVGICSHVAGVWAGFRGKELCVSEVMAPYAWPEAYRKTFDADIVAIVPFNDSLFVLTKTSPYVVAGALPETMIHHKLPFPQACVSKKSVTVTPYGVLYASHDGICLLTAASCDIVTQPVLTAGQWQSWNPDTICLIYYNDKIYAFSTDGAENVSGKGMVIDFRGDDGLVFLDVGSRVLGCFYEPETDGLMLILDRGGVRFLERWGGGVNSLPATWQSPVYRFHKPVNLACGVSVHDGPLSIAISADKAEQHIEDSSSGESFWLDSGFLAQDWYFSLSLLGEVRRIRFGFAKEDLR